MAKIEHINIKKDISLDDIYKEFGKQKKHYATRLKHAFLENHVNTIDDLMALSLHDISNWRGIGSETLRLLIKNLNSLGIDYFPLKTDGRTTD